jgi:hypothetical protein
MCSIKFHAFSETHQTLEFGFPSFFQIIYRPFLHYEVFLISQCNRFGISKIIYTFNTYTGSLLKHSFTLQLLLPLHYSQSNK